MNHQAHKPSKIIFNIMLALFFILFTICVVTCFNMIGLFTVDVNNLQVLFETGGTINGALPVPKMPAGASVSQIKNLITFTGVCCVLCTVLVLLMAGFIFSAALAATSKRPFDGSVFKTLKKLGATAIFYSVLQPSISSIY